MEDAPESIMDFAQARDNFYTCAQHGLDAHIVWLDGQKYPAQSLLQNVLLPLAKRGLTELGIYDTDISKYLSIISSRVRSSCNGASWQGVPVHDWDL
jgi:hypothetical protein